MAAPSDSLFSTPTPPSIRPDTPPGEPHSARPCVPVLRLASFMPFRLNRLATGVSDNLAEIYRRRFGLEIPEWRVIATAGYCRSCTAQQIADSTRMHKTRVSRAIAHLVGRGLIEKASNADDRREMALKLTKAGRTLYEELVPLALERERQLLACLTDSQMRALNEGLTRLEELLGLA